MRVIAGKARSIILRTVEGSETRPTTDRIKETLFNMIHTYLYDINFLDLFSGSGAIGIEAISRGAKKAVFVENNRFALDCIRQNLKAAKLQEQGEVLGMDVLSALKTLEGRGEVFDIIFLDPPYKIGLEQEVLNYLENSKLVGEDTIIIVEAWKDTDFTYLQHRGLELYKKKEYKTNMHVFIRPIAGKEII